MFLVLGDILLVTSAEESRRQIVVCPPVYAAAGLAISPVWCDERRRKQTANRGLSASLCCGVSYFPVWCWLFIIKVSLRTGPACGPEKRKGAWRKEKRRGRQSAVPVFVARLGTVVSTGTVYVLRATQKIL
jgi:hypothetical protein